MPLHLLCISRAADLRRQEAGGVSARSERSVQTPQWITDRELSAAVVPTLPRSSGPLVHAALLRAMFQQGDILPVRFGVVLPHDQAVQDLLRRRRADLLRALDRLQGTAEMGLRIELPDHRSPERPVAGGSDRPANSPVGYLAGRRAEYQWRDELTHRAQLAAESCIQGVNGLYRDWRRLSPEPPRTVRLAFLVERGRCEAFAERLTAARVPRGDEQYTLVGPWPPYSFV